MKNPYRSCKLMRGPHRVKAVDDGSVDKAEYNLIMQQFARCMMPAAVRTAVLFPFPTGDLLPFSHWRSAALFPLEICCPFSLPFAEVLLPGAGVWCALELTFSIASPRRPGWSNAFSMPAHRLPADPRSELGPPGAGQEAGRGGAGRRCVHRDGGSQLQ